MSVKSYILKEKEELITLRRWFHSHPEASLEEFETAAKIEEELDRYGISHHRIGKTGIYATIQGKLGPGKTIVLRSDIDALKMQDLKTEDYASKNEGYCHACGHDGHTATLLIAAKILKEKENEFNGEIRLFFQQGEEIGQGARQFVAAGLLENVDRVFGVHISSALETGTIVACAGPTNASCDYFKIEVKGRGAHVSTPHQGVDALYVASQIVVNLQSIVSRSTNPLDSVIVGIGVLQAGTQYNIVAENASIEGTTRTFTLESREKTNALVTKIANDIASTYGASATVTFKDFASPLINNEEVANEVLAIAKEIVGTGATSNPIKSLGADDYAEFLLEVKGMYAFVGTHNPDNNNTGVAHHHGLFDLDEDGLVYSCNLYVDYALSVLQNSNYD